MKAISIRAPWWQFIIRGDKPIENRAWSTNQRGRILIHASSFDGKRVIAADYCNALRCCAADGRSTSRLWPREYPQSWRGAIVGSVEIVDVVTEHRSAFFSGPYGWVLANPRRYLVPVPCKGQLRLWMPDDEILRMCRVQEARWRNTHIAELCEKPAQHETDWGWTS